MQRQLQFLFVAILHNQQLFTAALPPIQGGEGQRSTIPIIPCQNTQLNKHKQTNKQKIFFTSRPAANLLSYVELRLFPSPL